MARVRVVTGTTGPNANTVKTVNILSGDSYPNAHKTHSQIGATGHQPNTMPMFQAGPTGTKGIPTIVIPGYTGPA